MIIKKQIKGAKKLLLNNLRKHNLMQHYNYKVNRLERLKLRLKNYY